MMAQDERRNRTDDIQERTQSYEDARERPARDTENWLDAIGPEDLSRERVVENLEQYGFDIMDDDEQLSLESTGQAFGGAYQNGAYQDIEEVGDLITHDTPLDAEQQLELRPTEEEAAASVDGDDTTLDDEMPTDGTQPSGLS